LIRSCHLLSTLWIAWSLRIFFLCHKRVACWLQNITRKKVCVCGLHSQYHGETLYKFRHTLPPAITASYRQPWQTRPSLYISDFSKLFSNIRETLTDISGYIFTDQFYYSPTLASELSKVGCHLTGTWKDVPLSLKKKKSENSAYRNNENILLLAW
jgi:hypothetical protein